MPLSAKQMEYLALAWQCFETEPKIDYDKFHRLAGLASVHSARELMRVTKNKLKSEYGALGSGLQAANTNTATPSKSATGTPAKATTPAKKNTPAKATGTPKTPISRKRGAAKKARSEVEDDEEGEGKMDGESPTKKVKTEKGCDAGGKTDESGVEGMFGSSPIPSA